MMAEPENLFLVYLRRIDEKLDRVIVEVQDLKVRVTGLQEKVARVQLEIAGVNRRIDRVEERLDRIERPVWTSSRSRRRLERQILSVPDWLLPYPANFFRFSAP
jgi:predicted  nucleic acid-binding Zn-ribbon protein